MNIIQHLKEHKAKNEVQQIAIVKYKGKEDIENSNIEPTHLKEHVKTEFGIPQRKKHIKHNQNTQYKRSVKILILAKERIISYYFHLR